MAKAQEPANVDVVQDGARVTLAEFCARLSEKVSRPELIGGFEFIERRAGRQKDTASAYQQRFDTFVKTPV